MIAINKKEDILIPFNRIGEQGWEINTKTILESIAYNYNDELKQPVATSDIEALEKRLGAALPDHLKLFYQTFGIAEIGEQLQDLNAIGWIKDIWAAQPEYGPDFTEEDKQHLPFLISFSDYLGNGNMFCFHSETKAIYYYDHDTQPNITKLFDTVDDYLKGCLIFAQSELFGDADMGDVVNWTEEIVTELLGAATVKKWRY